MDYAGSESTNPCTQITITATHKAGSGGASEETESLTLWS